MNAFLTGVIFLVAFTATGKSIDCVSCSSTNGTDCSGEVTTCAEDQTFCQTARTELKKDGVASNQVYKYCGGDEEPHWIYREESLTTFFQLEVENCETDKCNEKPAQLTPRVNTPNGVKCMNCFKDYSADCNSEETIECTGDMNKCLFVSGNFCNNGTAFYACALRHCTNIASADLHPRYDEVDTGNIQKIEISEGIKDA
uniref:Sodefrin-like factor n=1 Tax=Plethodon wehrlei TaxID=154594 RepID=Q4FAG9_9SALA|nr:sodefrin precursor-like factor [Plethodon wehrlei]ABD34633.1 sodefrin precursor-like protein [Plethodon wehrlei]